VRIRNIQRLKALKFTSSIQVFISPAFWTALLFPQGVGAFLKMLFLRTPPMFVSPVVGADVTPVFHPGETRVRG
jgi:hypothetical protein